MSDRFASSDLRNVRIGLISDIHADYEGLQNALALLDRLGVDRILCAGDLVERGMGG